MVGLSLGTAFQFYSGTNTAVAVIGSAAGFGALTLYGFTTKRRLDRIGSFVAIALMGLYWTIQRLL